VYSKNQALTDAIDSNSDKQAMYWNIYDKYWKYILFICVKLCGNKEDGEELMQDAFIIAFKNIGQLKDKSKLKPWLAKIAVRECYKHNKKHRKIQTKELIPEEHIEVNDEFLPMTYLDKKELRDEVLEIINSLPEKQKKVIYLHYYANMKCEEIASLQKCSVDSVWNALHSARGNIKKKIEKKDNEVAYAKGFVSIGAFIAIEETAFVEEIGTAVAAETFAIITKAISVSKAVTYTAAVICATIVISCSILLYPILAQSEEPVYEEIPIASNIVQTEAQVLIEYEPYIEESEQEPDPRRRPIMNLPNIQAPQAIIETVREYVTGIFQPPMRDVVLEEQVLPEEEYVYEEDEEIEDERENTREVAQNIARISAANSELRYPKGSTVTREQLLADARITAACERGRSLEVGILHFEDIDFDTPGRYAVYAKAIDGNGEKVAQIVITIKVVN